MTDNAIDVSGLGKRYKLSSARQQYKTLRESIIAAIKAPFLPSATPESDGRDDSFWALKNVNFQIKAGEVVGIIGRNGAGKSTLLKVLSRITDPTEGEIDITGRVGSLLEVGTGFHPELSGRENIYLNGAILGMKRGEIASKFDAIIQFSEVEKFLDTPVKYYSSGMYMRLAFAVAAFLEPEILVVDEVLAVGDMAFQKKCLGRMGEVAGDGRTVLFVSHNMSAVQQLCTRCIMLAKGTVVADGPPSEVVPRYLREAAPTGSATRVPKASGEPTIISAAIVPVGEASEAQMQITVVVAASSSQLAALDIRLTDGSGFAVGFGSLGTFAASEKVLLQAGLNTFEILLPGDRLAVGSYFASLDLTLPFVRYLDRFENALSFDITRPPRPGRDRALDQRWSTGTYEVPLQLVGRQQGTV